MTMNRAQRRQAAKDLQSRLKDPDLAGAVDLAELSQRPKAITFGYLIDENVSAEFLRSVLATASRSTQYGFAIRPRDVEVAVERPKAYNLLLKSFLETEDDYLLLAGTDIAFAPQDVAMLIAADAAIAGALYFTAATGAEPWPTAWVEGDIAEGEATETPRQPYVPVPLPKPPEDFDEADEAAVADWLAKLSVPIPVAGVGFGLVLIQRECARNMVENYEWPFEAVQDRREDLIFCLRAKELGFETVLMPAARVGHMRQAML